MSFENGNNFENELSYNRSGWVHWTSSSTYSQRNPPILQLIPLQAAALLKESLVSKLVLTDVFEPSLPKSIAESPKVETHCLAADLTSLETCQSLFTKDLNLVYVLHGIMSSAAEANFELGLRVNLDSTRQIFDVLRRTAPGITVVYPSSLAVYGPPATATTSITELNTPVPGTSYGAQKHICETLLDDYSRRGFLDGRICRLPTVSSSQRNGCRSN